MFYPDPYPDSCRIWIRFMVSCFIHPYLENNTDPGGGPVDVEGFRQLEDGLGAHVRRVHDQHEVEEVFPDAAQHAGERWPQHLLHAVRPTLVVQCCGSGSRFAITSFFFYFFLDL